MSERQAFLKALEANEDDTQTRMVYADWLEEQGEDDEAERQRNWPAAKAWLTEWARSINDREYEKNADGKWVPTWRREEGPHTYAHALQAGYDALSGEGYCFGTDAGADFFYPWKEGEDGAKNSAEFFRNWSIVTGVPVPESVVKEPPFRCGC